MLAAMLISSVAFAVALYTQVHVAQVHVSSAPASIPLYVSTFAVCDVITATLSITTLVFSTCHAYCEFRLLLS